MSSLAEAALTALDIGEIDRAQALLGEGEELAERCALGRQKVDALQRFGALHHQVGRLPTARRYYQDVLALDTPFGNCHCAVRLGILSLEEPKAEEACEFLARGIAFCGAVLRQIPRFYRALYDLGLGYLASGRTDQAFAVYHQALGGCSAKGVVESALRDLRLLERARPDTPGMAETFGLLRDALSACERKEGDSGLAWTKEP